MACIHNDPIVRAILAYVAWYRRQYGIQVGTIFYTGCDDLSPDRERVERLARDEFGQRSWLELNDEQAKLEFYAYVAFQVSLLRQRGMNIDNWPEQAAWQLTTDVVKVVRYVRDFRYCHEASPDNPRQFRHEGPMGELVLGQLINTWEFTGSWERLSDPKTRADAAAFVDSVIHRLEPYRKRRATSVPA